MDAKIHFKEVFANAMNIAFERITIAHSGKNGSTTDSSAYPELLNSVLLSLVRTELSRLIDPY